MEITNLQLLAIALICLAAIIYYTWRSESVDRIAFLARERDAAKKQEERDADERERRRMVHEADSKPVSMERVGGIDPTIAAALVGARVQQATNAYNTDEYQRRLNAGIANQHSASMDPFCGEGKKP